MGNQDIYFSQSLNFHVCSVWVVNKSVQRTKIFGENMIKYSRMSDVGGKYSDQTRSFSFTVLLFLSKPIFPILQICCFAFIFPTHPHEHLFLSSFCKWNNLIRKHFSYARCSSTFALSFRLSVVFFSFL